MKYPTCNMKYMKMKYEICKEGILSLRYDYVIWNMEYEWNIWNMQKGNACNMKYGIWMKYMKYEICKKGMHVIWNMEYEWNTCICVIWNMKYVKRKCYHM